MGGLDEPAPGVRWVPGLHASDTAAVNRAEYFRYIGRWSALFVPAVLAAAGVGGGGRVLDVAAGPGEAMLPASRVVGPGGRVVGSDISAAMMAAARSRLPRRTCLLVVADGQALPFADGCFDAVICQLGLMFFPDPAAGLREFRRVLRPAGRAGVCVISTADQTPMWGALAEALGVVLPRERTMLRLSFALADAARLRSLFGTAGYADVHVQRVVRSAVFSSFEDYWAGIEVGTGQLPQAYCGLAEDTRRWVREDVRRRLAHYQSDGRLVLPIEMLIAAGQA
jgi:SAM-dependent methyltransferase